MKIDIDDLTAASAGKKAQSSQLCLQRVPGSNPIQLVSALRIWFQFSHICAGHRTAVASAAGTVLFTRDFTLDWLAMPTWVGQHYWSTAYY